MQQITDKLYIGNMEDAISSTIDPNIDVIVYLGQEAPTKLCFNCSPMCIHLPLNDGANGSVKVKRVIHMISVVLSESERILIACRAGISRSVAVTTAVLALTENISFKSAYKRVKTLRPQSSPERNLLLEMKRATEELSKCYT